MIKVLLFAGLREDLGVDSTQVSGGDQRISELIRSLATQHGSIWQETLTAENILVAVNQTMVKGDHAVSDGDEVAFFPPVTGG